MEIERLRKANPHLTIRGISEQAFGAYGRILDPEPYAELVRLADRITEIDLSSNKYVASLPDFESPEFIKPFQARFGCAPVQVGYCNGPNSRLNALEWHKSIEIDIAVTDLILLLGARSRLDAEGFFDSSSLECFFLPKGTVVELLPEVLHFSPCRVEAGGFKSVIALPRGTNEAMDADYLPAGTPSPTQASPMRDIESRLLFMKNKWLIAHPERKQLIERGAFAGIRGVNIEIALP